MFNKPASPDTTSKVTPPVITIESPVTETTTPAPQPPKKSSKKLLLIVSAIILLLTAAVGAFALMQQPTNNQPDLQPTPVPTETPQTTPEPTEETVFCTMDAKICPDGSSVGRIPPSCEFAECPEEVPPLRESTDSATPALDIDVSDTATDSSM